MRSLAPRNRGSSPSSPRPDTVITPLFSLMVMTSSPLVALMTMVSAAPSPTPLPGGDAEVDADLLDAGPGQVVDGYVISAAQCGDIDVLDAVEVHGDVADVAGEPHRLPLAEMSIFSATLAPLNCSVSVPAWPSTVSLPSPGFQTKVSLPPPGTRRRCRVRR